MTSTNDPASTRNVSSSAASAESADAQSLTDLIDQLDRAAFRRTLAKRDVKNREYQEETARERLARSR